MMILNHLPLVTIPFWRPLASAERADALCTELRTHPFATDLIPLKLQKQFDLRFLRNLGATWSKWNERNGETDAY